MVGPEVDGCLVVYGEGLGVEAGGGESAAEEGPV